MDTTKIQSDLQTFATKRDWNQFHSPKNLAMALNVEAAELLEHFQWLNQAQSADLDDDTRNAVATESADIQIYLLRLADKLGIDIEQAVAWHTLRQAVIRQGDRTPVNRAVHDPNFG